MSNPLTPRQSEILQTIVPVDEVPGLIVELMAAQRGGGGGGAVKLGY